LGLIFSAYTTADRITSIDARLEGVKSVIWFSGDAERNLLLADDRAVLMDYLDNGGNLFLTGQSFDLVADADEFFRDYVGATHTIDSLHQVWIEGVENDPVARGMQLLLLGSGGAQNQYRPGAIAAVEPAVEIYHWTRYDGDPACGIRREDPHSGARVVYFSFGLEAVGGHGYTDSRSDALVGVLNWFGIESDVDEPDLPMLMPEAFQLGQPYPNPFNHRVNVPVTLARSGEVGLQIFDVAGRQVWTGSALFPAGRSVWTISGRDWGSGVYMIMGNAPGGNSASRVTLIK
jgi:hypothetical protein